MSARSDQFVESSPGPERVIGLSDAIFAFSITLSVLAIDLPDNLPVADLPRQLGALWPHFLTYGINFLVVARYWVAHHQVFHNVKRYDARLIWLNNLFLLTITLVPFLSKLLGQYGDAQIAVVVYAGTLALSGILLALARWYAWGHPEITGQEVGRREFARRLGQGLVAPAVFVVSIGISYVSPSAAMYSWLLLMPLQPLVRRILAGCVPANGTSVPRV